MTFEDGTHRLSLTSVTKQPTPLIVTEEWKLLPLFIETIDHGQQNKIWESSTGFLQANVPYKFRDLVGLTTNCLLQLYLKLIPRWKIPESLIDSEDFMKIQALMKPENST